MPPKKGKKKDKKGKSPQKLPEVLPLPPLDDNSKGFYLEQLHDLEQRLERYQRKCDELEFSSGKVTTHAKQVETDKMDICNYMKKLLGEKEEEVTNLRERLVGLQQAKEQESQRAQDEILKLRNENQETKDSLSHEITVLTGKLIALEEFKLQRERMVSEIEQKKETIQKMEEDHKKYIEERDRADVLNRDALKKEMLTRVTEVAAEFRKISNKQMAETTKRTIRENVAINAQLNRMSTKTEELVRENDALKEKEKDLRRTTGILESNEKESAKKYISNQRVIRMLTDKCKQQEVDIIELREKEHQYADRIADIEEENRIIAEKIGTPEELAGQVERLQQQVEQLQVRVEDEMRSRHSVEKVLRDTAEAVKSSLYNTDLAFESRLEERDQMLERLLILLNTANAVGLGPAVEEFRPRSEFPGSRKGVRKGQYVAPQPVPVTPHYRPGDLGFVPRPAQHIPTKLEQTRRSKEKLDPLPMGRREAANSLLAPIA